MRPVAMTEEQVRSLNLPSTPLKETERRAEEWLARSGGLEQTEIDALAVLRPEMLIEIAHAAIAPFFDADLAARQREAEEAWLEEARAALADIDRATLAPFEARLQEEAQKVVPIARAFNAAADAWSAAAQRIGRRRGIRGIRAGRTCDQSRIGAASARIEPHGSRGDGIAAFRTTGRVN